MAVPYRITKRRNNIKNTEEEQYILQAVTRKTVNLDRICFEISNSCTLAESDVVGVIMALQKRLIDNLDQGNAVDLGYLGKFKIGFKGVAAPKAELLSKESILKFNLNYQPSKGMKFWLKKNVKIEKE
jgi:predicted histone-like DNA-binding protein